ncbi:MAG: hypothetical protein IPI84_06980 [Holophagaceae bacterium]|nr:hypothetical protein [Holophagaceae bacterium]
MMSPVERRQTWSRIVGVERRAAPMQVLDGRPLPDPTRLEDEDFLEARRQRERDREMALAHMERWHDPTRFD